MESSSALLSTMEDLLMWSKSQMEHFELDIDSVDIKQLFDDTTSLMQNQAEAKNLSLEVKDIAMNGLQSDQNLLTIVLRNLLQNAINHSYSDTKIYL
ncbi:MAG: HAMP domain-containing histidine kinase, partial [Chitinophagaceae bacterium]